MRMVFFLLVAVGFLSLATKPVTKIQYILNPRIVESLSSEVKDVKTFLDLGKGTSFYFILDSSSGELDLTLSRYRCKKCPISEIVSASNRYILLENQEYRVLSWEDLSYSEPIVDYENFKTYGYGNGLRILFNREGELTDKYFTQ